MFKLVPVDFLLLSLPEAFIVLYAIFSFSRKHITLKNYFLCGIIAAICSYATRQLPVAFGVHTILDIIVLIILSIFIIKISTIKSISYSLLSILMLSICEMITLVLYIFIFKIDIQSKFSNTIRKDLYGLPSMVLFVLIILIYNRINQRKKKNKD